MEKLSHLKPREYQVYCLVCLEGHRQFEAAKIMNTSRISVRRLLKSVVAKVPEVLFLLTQNVKQTCKMDLSPPDPDVLFNRTKKESSGN
jgi:predicted DNA-binding protein (UPF0251 family)